MLRNLKAPETYFQAAFRVQSPWAIKNPNGDDPNEEAVLMFVIGGDGPRAEFTDDAMGRLEKAGAWPVRA